MYKPLYDWLDNQEGRSDSSYDNIQNLLRTNIRKIEIEGKRYYEVRYKEEKGSRRWTAADIHEELRDAAKQRDYILAQM